MAVDHGHGQVAALDPHRTRSIVEGLAALICLAIFSAAFFGALTLGVVQLVRLLAA